MNDRTTARAVARSAAATGAGAPRRTPKANSPAADAAGREVTLIAEAPNTALYIDGKPLTLTGSDSRARVRLKSGPHQVVVHPPGKPMRTHAFTLGASDKIVHLGVPGAPASVAAPAAGAKKN